MCWNVRSINNKVDKVLDYIIAKNISLFFVTETWLTDNNNHTTATIKSYGYNIFHYHRPMSQNGGGVAIVYKPTLNVVRVFVKHAKTFEQSLLN